VAAPEMTAAPSRIPVHKKAVPSFSEEDVIVAAPVTVTKPTSYVLDVDPPISSTTSSMVFDSTTFAQSLGKDPAWAAVLAPTTASANPFEDPVNPFADPQPKTRLSEMPAIPKHLRMSTTSSTLSRDAKVRSPVFQFVGPSLTHDSHRTLPRRRQARSTTRVSPCEVAIYPVLSFCCPTVIEPFASAGLLCFFNELFRLIRHIRDANINN
jgi:hypothetical protein